MAVCGDDARTMYDDMVAKISNAPVLKAGVDDMVKNAFCMDLVCDGWEKKLKSSATFERFAAKKVRFTKGKVAENFHVRRVASLEETFHVVVAGLWSLDESVGRQQTSLVCAYSKPLEEIGRVMAEHDRQVLFDNCRFFGDHCITGGCHECRDYERRVGGERPRGDSRDWCVRNVKIFDGRDMFRASRNSILVAFERGSFAGVLRLRAHNRVTYGEGSYKITGVCHDMILFKESTLTSRANELRFFDPLTPSTGPSLVPAITMVEDDDDDANLKS